MYLLDFHIPDKKYELILYLGKEYPQDLAKFRKLRKAILKAIYINLRKRQNGMYVKEANREKKLQEM